MMTTFYLAAFLLAVLKLLERSLLKWPSFICKHVNEFVWTIIWVGSAVYWYKTDDYRIAIVSIALYGMSVGLVDALLKLYSLYTKKHPGPAKYFLTNGKYLTANSDHLNFREVKYPLLSFKIPQARKDKKSAFNDEVEKGGWLGISHDGICKNPKFKHVECHRTFIPVIGYQNRRERITVETVLYSVGEEEDPTSEKILGLYINAEAESLLERYSEQWAHERDVKITAWDGLSRGEVLAYRIYSNYGVEYKLVFQADDHSLLSLVFYQQGEHPKRIEGFSLEQYLCELIDIMDLKIEKQEQAKVQFDNLLIRNKFIIQQN